MTALLKHPAVVVLVTMVALFYYLSLDRSAKKAAISSETVASLESEVDLAAQEVSVLEKQLEAANHPISQEKVIRNELLLQKPGEYVFQIPNITVEEAAVAKQEETTPWQEWQKVFFAQ